MAESAPGEGVPFLEAFLRRNREKAMERGETPLLPKNMNKLVELIDKEIKRGSTFEEAFDYIFPMDWWQKAEISPENLPRYAEFARDYFSEKYPKIQKDLFDD